MNTVLRIATALVALLPAVALASGFPVTVTSCGQPLTFDRKRRWNYTCFYDR